MRERSFLVIAAAVILIPLLAAVAVLAAIALRSGFPLLAIAGVVVFAVAAGIDGYRRNPAMARTFPDRMARLHGKREAEDQALATLHERYGNDRDQDA